MTDLVVSKLERVAAVSSIANFEAFYVDIIALNGTPCPEGGRYPISEHEGRKLLPRAPQIDRAIEAARRPATREEIAIHLAMLRPISRTARPTRTPPRSCSNTFTHRNRALVQ